MRISRGPTSPSLFLLIVMLHLSSSLWTPLMKMLKIERSYPRKSSKRATGDGQSVSVRTTSRLGRRFVHSCKVDTTFRILARRVFGSYTVWDAVTCFLGWITCPSFMQANSFRPPMRMTVYASGVRRLRSQRQTRGPQVRTLRLLPTSELPCESSANFPKTQARRAGSASHSSANKKVKVGDFHGSFFFG